MSCDVTRREGWKHAIHRIEQILSQPLMEELSKSFGKWLDDQMKAASRGGSGSKRSTAGPGPTPAPPKDFKDLEGVFRSVKKSAEQRQRDWRPTERTGMEQKFDRLWEWLQTDAGLRDPTRPVKGTSEYPRVSSLAGYAALWDYVVLIEELADIRPVPQPEHEDRVLVFFYGPDIDLSELAAAGLVPERHEPAHVEDFELVIAPFANLVPSPGSAVHGILATATHSELDRLHGVDGTDGAAVHYEPQAVLAMTADGHEVPALAYVSHDMKQGQPTPGYVDDVMKAADQYHFPEWYLAHIRSFAA